MRIDDINNNGNNYSKNILKLGFYTIDFHENFIFQALKPANSDEHYEFGEESSSRREYRSDQSRFTTNIAKASLKTGNDGKEWCKLGNDWFRKNNNKWPSIKQMRVGIKAQEKVQLQKSSGLDPKSKEFQEVYK